MPRRLSLWLLATAGVVVGHLLGYAVAHPTGSDRAAALAGHEYLGTVGTVLLPLGLAAAMVTAVRMVRRIGGAPTLVSLAGLQVALFCVQEVVERIPGPGAPVDVLAERGVWFGIAAQVLVAWLALRLVHCSSALVRLVVGGLAPRSAAAPLRRVLPLRERTPSPTVSHLLPSRRGPPVVAHLSAR